MHWNLNEATVAKEGRNQQTPHGLQRDANFEDRGGLDGQLNQDTPMQQRINRGSMQASLFNSHHRSILPQAQPHQFGASRDSVIGEQLQPQISLYRAQRPTPQPNPVNRYSGLPSNRSKQHIPLYSQMAPKLNKTRLLHQVEKPAPDLSPFTANAARDRD